jgi:AraC family transcriptional regulator
MALSPSSFAWFPDWSPARLMKFGELYYAHHDGTPPLTLSAGSAAGESGVSLLRAKFKRGTYSSGVVQQHKIFFQLSPQLRRLECRMAGQTLRHQTHTGSLAICPAGIDSSADIYASIDLLLIAIEPSQLALAAAEDAAIEAQLHERLSGYDQQLFRIARALESETADGYPNGPLFWNEAANGFINRLILGHTSIPDSPTRGTLSKHMLGRIRDYILANLAEPIEVAELAELAGRSSFHFSRVFARSVGMTPHRYVVHLRLRAAIEQLREGRGGLAEIAADTGFADQSHLSRWVRRVHGVTPSELA